MSPQVQIRRQFHLQIAIKTACPFGSKQAIYVHVHTMSSTSHTAFMNSIMVFLSQ